MAKESEPLPAIIANDHYVEVWDDIGLGGPDAVQPVAVDCPRGDEAQPKGGSFGTTTSVAPTRRSRYLSLGTTPPSNPRRRWKQFCLGALVLLLGCTGLTIGLASRGIATASKIVAAVPGSSVIPGVGDDNDDDGPCSTARWLMRLQDEAGTQSVRGARADPCFGDNGQDGATVEVPTYLPTKWPTYSPSESKVEGLETMSPTVVEVERLETTLPPTKTDIIKSPTAAPIPSNIIKTPTATPIQSISPTEEEIEQDEEDEEKEENTSITVTTTTDAPRDEAQTSTEALSTQSPPEETQESSHPTASPTTFNSTAAPIETDAEAEAENKHEEGCPDPYEREKVYPPGSLVSVSGTVYLVRA